MRAQRLRLEFAPQANRAYAPSLWLLLAALLLLAAVAAQVAQKIYANTLQQQTIAALENRGQPDKVRAQAQPKADPADKARAQFVRQTSQRLTTPWADLLSVLEDAPQNVALMAVEPSAAKRSVSLTVEAANAVDMLAYLQVLQTDTRFSNVVLVSHQVQVQAPGSPLRFQVRANWGDAP